jgi:hypothetical protein
MSTGEEDLYPLTLSYTDPTGQKVRALCRNEAEADQAFREMFDLCGDGVRYSVD